MKKPHPKAKNKSAKRPPRAPHQADRQPMARPMPGLKAADLFGFHAVQAAWLNPKRQIETLYCTQNALSGFEDTLKQAQSAGLSRPGASIVDKAALERALPPSAVHQGLALVCKPLPELGLEDILIRHRGEDSGLLVMLDQVTDPHNVGAILRSACAFGAQGLVMQSKHAPEIDGVLAKAACGAIEHVPMAYETNLSRAIEMAKEHGYFVYGLDERGEDITRFKKGGKSMLVLGAEGPGMRRLVKEHCDALLRLPMQGPMPSINVSNAAAIALYEFSKS